MAVVDGVAEAGAAWPEGDRHHMTDGERRADVGGASAAAPSTPCSSSSSRRATTTSPRSVCRQGNRGRLRRNCLGSADAGAGRVGSDALPRIVPPVSELEPLRPLGREVIPAAGKFS